MDPAHLIGGASIFPYNAKRLTHISEQIAGRRVNHSVTAALDLPRSVRTMLREMPGDRVRHSRISKRRRLWWTTEVLLMSQPLAISRRVGGYELRAVKSLMNASIRDWR